MCRKDDNIRSLGLQPNVRDFPTRRLFKNLMSDYSRVCSALIRNHLGRYVTKLIFVSLFAQAQGRAATVRTGRNGSEHALCVRGTNMVSRKLQWSVKKQLFTVGISATPDNSNGLSLSMVYCGHTVRRS